MELPPEGWFASTCCYCGPPPRTLLVRLYPEDTSDKRQELARYWVCYGCSFVRLHADWCCGKFTCHQQANGMYVIESKLNDCRIECMGCEILDHEGWAQLVRSESLLKSSVPPALAPETLPSHPHWADKAIAQRFDALLSRLEGRPIKLIEDPEIFSLFEGLYATLWALGRTGHVPLMVRIQPSPGAEQPSLFLFCEWWFVSTPISWVFDSVSYSEWRVEKGIVSPRYAKLASAQSEFQLSAPLALFSETMASGGLGPEDFEYKTAVGVLQSWTESMLNGYYL